ncbi:hypothetical protein V502_04360 [Pseudogymnoascus sp. VKM F-4520 (FW-2644)]|nr:hypothetical protein V502_04360 [Pseudogymnoascus sp. VKM F-4520 (FW-2644)]
MRSIINGCDVPVNGSNPMNWKQGGKRVQGVYTYRIDIFRQNRPWPPPTQPKQSCEGWYKIIWQHYDIYGAGWANYDWGGKSLLPAINSCCGLGSLTGWNFEYFDQPDDNGYEWHSWFNTAIGTRRRCFDNNRIQCAAGGPFTSQAAPSSAANPRQLTYLTVAVMLPARIAAQPTLGIFDAARVT